MKRAIFRPYFLGPNPSNQCSACCTHLCSVAHSLSLSPCVCCCVLPTLLDNERANDQFPLSLIPSPVAVAQICSAEGSSAVSPPSRYRSESERWLDGSQNKPVHWQLGFQAIYFCGVKFQYEIPSPGLRPCHDLLRIGDRAMRTTEALLWGIAL